MATPGRKLPQSARDRIVKLLNEGRFSRRTIATICKVSKRIVDEEWYKLHPPDDGGGSPAFAPA